MAKNSAPLPESVIRGCKKESHQLVSDVISASELVQEKQKDYHESISQRRNIINELKELTEYIVSNSPSQKKWKEDIHLSLNQSLIDLGVPDETIITPLSILGENLPTIPQNAYNTAYPNNEAYIPVMVNGKSYNTIIEDGVQKFVINKLFEHIYEIASKEGKFKQEKLDEMVFQKQLSVEEVIEFYLLATGISVKNFLELFGDAYIENPYKG